MKKLNILSFIILLILSVTVFGQSGWQPPKPIQNDVLNSMVGEWKGQADMGGQKFDEEMKIYWGLNGQYLFWEVRSATKDNTWQYEGLGLFTLTQDGKVQGWWFDDWGAGSMMTGTGSISGNSVALVSKSSFMTDERVMEVKDGDLIIDWKSLWKEDGQDKEMKGQTVFKRK